MKPSDIEKTAVTTPSGLYKWLYLPFGLRNVSQTLQRYLDNIFLDVECIFIYIDDILILSKHPEQHERDLAKVFGILRDHDLRIAIDKSEFFKESIN